MAGRKPTPTSLKLVRGNPGKRRLPENEPKPAGMATMPKFLTGRAAAIWKEYAPELIRLGLLTSLDGYSFAVWCSLTAQYEENEAMNAGRLAQMRGLAACFGLEPASRARLSPGGAEEPEDDPAEAYFR